MSEITLTREEVIKEIKQIRATLYHSHAKTMTRRNFKSLRPNEQLQTEQSWQRQLVALDLAVEVVVQERKFFTEALKARSDVHDQRS